MAESYAGLVTVGRRQCELQPGEDEVFKNHADILHVFGLLLLLTLGGRASEAGRPCRRRRRTTFATATDVWAQLYTIEGPEQVMEEYAQCLTKYARYMETHKDSEAAAKLWEQLRGLGTR